MNATAFLITNKNHYYCTFAFKKQYTSVQLFIIWIIKGITHHLDETPDGENEKQFSRDNLG
ncbi:hypothetical protein DM784_12410 [Vibrio furnissii]|nr:hypothetical protein DM784_12410 [Vibrio furnissii]